MTGTSINITSTFNNSGTVNVNSGTVVLHGSGTETGSFNALAGTELSFQEVGPANENYNLNAGTTLSGPGLYDLNGPFTMLSVNTPLSVANFEIDNGTLAAASSS